MKTTIYFSTTLILILSACSGRVQTMNEKTSMTADSKHINATYTDSIYCDDLNLDGYPDTIFVITSPTITDLDSLGNPIYTIGCATGDCQNSIRFSCGWPDLQIENSVWATVVRAGDLNFDGNSELLVSPNWFIGYQKRALLYTLKNDSWHIAAQVNCRLDGDESNKELSDILLLKNGKWYLKGIHVEKDDEPYFVPVQL